MIVMTIGLTRCVDETNKRLNKELDWLRQEGIKVELVEEKKGGITFLTCDIDGENPLYEEEGFRERLCASISKALSELIVGDAEEHFVERLIRRNHTDFAISERKMILEIVKELLHPCSNEDKSGIMRYKKRKEEIYSILYDYLRDSDQLILDGFIRFRLKDYVEELEDTIDIAVDSYLTKKEYGEFVKLLRYFLELQEPRMDEVQVILEKEGFFKLLDGKNNMINNEYLEGFILDMVDNDVNYDDLLISALITIAPAKIVLHFQDERNVIGTIQDVFIERVALCQGCSLCKPGAKPLGK